MSDFAEKLLPLVKKTLREASSEFDDEIGSYIDTVATDLQDSGIHYSFFSSTMPGWAIDGQILQACRWYALSVFGLYNPDMEKYAKAYSSLKATLATQKRYTSKGQYPTGYEHGYENGYEEGYNAALANKNLQSKTATPRSTDQTIVADAEYAGLLSVVVKGDENLVAENIAEGVSIFGVEGTHSGGAVAYEEGYNAALAKRTDLVVTANGEYTPPSESTGFKSVSVNVETGSVGGNKLAQILDRSVTEITEADLAGITKVGDYAFSQCKQLKSVIFPSAIVEIVNSAFQSAGLESVTFARNGGLTTIGSNAFQSCSNLKSLDIPASVTTIGKNAFTSCWGLETFRFDPNSSVTKIDYYAFGSCSKLATFLITATTPPSLGTSVFQSCSALAQIIVPDGCGDAYKSATNWSAYADIIVEESEAV